MLKLDNFIEFFYANFIAAMQLMEYNELETGSAHPPDGNENKIK